MCNMLIWCQRGHPVKDVGGVFIVYIRLQAATIEKIGLHRTDERPGTPDKLIPFVIEMVDIRK